MWRALIAGLMLLAWWSTAPAATDPREALKISQAAIGRTVPDFRFTDSEGQPLRMADLRGKPLVVSFIYTGCFQACPVATQFLAQAVATARTALGTGKFNVVSIGFNQPFDNPVAMAAFARQNRISDPGWRFLTPDTGTLETLVAAFGFVYEATPKGFDHITQVSIVDADGVIYRQVYGETFELPMLVQPLKELLSGQASKQVTVEAVWEKVKLYCTVYDPFTGGYRVNYSIFVEIFAGLTTLGAVAWFIGRQLRATPRL